MKASLWRTPAPLRTTSGPPGPSVTLSSILTPSISSADALGASATVASSNIRNNILIIVCYANGSKCFEYAGSAHARAYAHRDHAIFLLAAAHAMHQRRRTHRTRRTERMPEGNRTAERIDFERI